MQSVYRKTDEFPVAFGVSLSDDLSVFIDSGAGVKTFDVLSGEQVPVNGKSVASDLCQTAPSIQVFGLRQHLGGRVRLRW
jgi:hypothetical protein